MKTVRMLTDAVGGEGEPLKAGKTYDLNDASADRWLRRGKAELVEVVDEDDKGSVDGAGNGAGGDDKGASKDGGAGGGAKPSEGLTVAEIKEALAAAEIDIPDGVTLKTDLAKLLDDHAAGK